MLFNMKTAESVRCLCLTATVHLKFAMALAVRFCEAHPQDARRMGTQSPWGPGPCSTVTGQMLGAGLAQACDVGLGL